MVGRKSKDMITSVAVTSVGQITLPKVMRDAYGIVDRVDIKSTKDGILVVKAKSLDEKLAELRASFSPELKERIKANAGKTASELRAEMLKTSEWAEHTKEHYGV